MTNDMFFNRKVDANKRVRGRIAAFDGRCPICQDIIEADIDVIVYDSWENAWVHIDCAEKNEDAEND